jgi:hypothetical protein
MEKLRTTHNEFQYLQEKYHIPRDFCMPADFFREEQLDPEVAYYKRCCSVYDFYNMLSIDSPGYVDKETRRANNKSLRQESHVTQDSAKRRVNPSFNPFDHAGVQPHRQNVVTNPSNLDWEQRESAEKAEVRRSAPKKNAPIPSDGDETNTDDETNHLFENKLSAAEKGRILQLTTEIKRLKMRIYTPAYLKDRERSSTMLNSIDVQADLVRNI